MKNLYFLLLLFLAFSCKKPDPLEPNSRLVLTELSNGRTQIAGYIDRDFTITNDREWELSGGVFVEEGYTLTIDSGVSVFASNDGTTPFLSIQRGAKILADGTKTNPIIFTSDLEEPGAWGGLVINGYGVLNTGETAEGEGGTGIYGGNNNSDNSGTLRYVRVEYAGKILGTDNELNGFSFNGVGDETVVEYIEAYRGADDGIEFFGGAVNVKWAVSLGNHDDSFDWTHGWSGKGQYWYAKQLSDGGDRGIEADNNGDDNNANPYSNPILVNVTLEGIDDGDGDNTGIRLREGTKGKLYNIEVFNFPKYGVRVSDSLTLLNMNNGELVVSNSNVHSNGQNYKDCEDFENLLNEANDVWFDLNSNVGANYQTWTAYWTKGL